MKVTEIVDQNQDMLPEYHLDNYAKAKPNRFASQAHSPVTVILDPDVAQIFTTSDSVNTALRTILAAVPHSQDHGNTG